jgi:hypothetical protein
VYSQAIQRAEEGVEPGALALWDEARAGHCTADHCGTRSREFQDAIYARRAESPLIFPFIYWLMRNDLEEQMNVGAAERMRELGLAVNDEPGGVA